MRHLLINELKNVITIDNYEENNDLISESEEVFLKWKNQLDINNIDYLPIKLKNDSLNSNQFKNLIKFYLNKKSESISNEFLYNPNLINLIQEDSNLGYLILFEDLINNHLNEINRFLSTDKISKILGENNSAILESFLRYLIISLERISEKTLFYEFKVWESEFKNQKKNEHTKLFYEKLKEKKYKDYLYNEYPVLFRLVKGESLRQKNNLLELLNRLANDYEEIQNLLIIGRDNKISSIDFGLGDRHNDGKTVSIINLEKGNKIVYKPHSLQTEVSFVTLLKDISKDLKHEITIPKTITKEEHGWQEFVTHEKTDNYELLREYYYKIGAYLAIFHFLNGGDLHFENVISCLSDPMIIDLETLFQPKFSEREEEKPLSFDNISKVALLPFMIDVGGESIELGGLADPRGQKSPINNTKFNQDTGKLDTEDVFFVENKNIPFTEASKYNLSDFTDPIIEGFSDAYQVFLVSKNEKLKLINELFKDCKIRVLVRDTLMYSHLLKEATHPSLFTNGFEIDMHLDWLWGQVAHYKYLEPIVEIEKKSLINFDIPYFFTRFDSKRLYSICHGDIEDFFYSSPRECVLESINKLSEKDLKSQIWVIKASIIGYDRNKKERVYNNFDSKSQKEFLEINFLNEAKKIGDGLMEVSFENDRYASWLNIEFSGINNEFYSVGETDYSFHNGLLGDLVFFSALAIKSKEEKYTIFAGKVYNYLIENIKKDIFGITNIGAHTGLGGLIYSLSTLFEITKNDTYLLDLESIMENLDLKELINNNDNNSLVKGNAGFLLALCKYYRFSKNKNQIVDAINFCAKKIIQNSITEDDFIYWLPEYNKNALTGLAHGASGYALAFFKAFEVTKDNEYLTVIQKIITFENSFYNTQSKNWSDRRDFITKEVDRYKSFGWSHGAPGIGMVRLKLLESKVFSGYFKDILKTDLEISIDSTIKNGFTRNNDSLVFGKMGNLDFLMQSCNYFQNKAQYSGILMNIISQQKISGWNLGFNSSLFYKPGLMTGCSGIGYQLLRSLDTNLPSVLTLD